MHLWADQPTRSVEVVYYFVPPDRPLVPQPHRFGPRVWLRDEPLIWDDLGEERDYHPYARGGSTSTADGRGVCGRPEQWRDGCLSTDSVPLINPNTGLPACCSGPILGRGGLSLGGNSGWPAPYCPQDIPPRLWITVNWTPFPFPQPWAQFRFTLYGSVYHLDPGQTFPPDIGLPVLDLTPPATSADPWILRYTDGRTFTGLADCCPVVSTIIDAEIPPGPVNIAYSVVCAPFYNWQGAGTGGLAVGGFGFFPTRGLQLGTGGLAVGGSSRGLDVQLGRGGLAVGGSGSRLAQEVAQGGIALGGTGYQVGLIVADGGFGRGGTGFP